MLTLRHATGADLAAMLAIYTPYVNTSTATFEYTPPGVDEFAARFAQFTADFPWLVAEREGRVIAYAYAHKMGTRPGYGWSAELTVYVDEHCRRSGAGRALYRAIIELLRAQGYRKLYGIVAHPNPASEALHESLGFKLEGRMQNCGYKFGRPVSSSYYGIALAPPTENPAPPTPFTQLDKARVAEVLSAAATPSE